MAVVAITQQRRPCSENFALLLLIDRSVDPVRGNRRLQPEAQISVSKQPPLCLVAAKAAAITSQCWEQGTVRCRRAAR